MTIKTFDRAKTKRIAFVFGLLFIFAQTLSVQIDAQVRRKATARTAKKKVAAKPRQPAGNAEQDFSSLYKVTQIDEIALKNLLKRDGENNKPLLINFWATWCDPCREEFPDLVKLDAEYKGKIDLITISLDDLAEIKRDVPKFLAQMKAEMPSYLLKSANDEAAIASVSKSWQGGLPFTILFDGKGESVYFIQGKFKTDVLKAQIEKIFQSATQQYTFEKGKEDAEKDIAESKLVVKANERHHSRGSTILPWQRSQVVEENLWEKYKVVLDYIPTNVREKIDYIKGYNSVSLAEIKKKYGEDVLNQIKRKFTVNYPADVTKLKLAQK